MFQWKPATDDNTIQIHQVENINNAINTTNNIKFKHCGGFAALISLTFEDGRLTKWRLACCCCFPVTVCIKSWWISFSFLALFHHFKILALRTGEDDFFVCLFWLIFRKKWAKNAVLGAFSRPPYVFFAQGVGVWPLPSGGGPDSSLPAHLTPKRPLNRLEKLKSFPTQSTVFCFFLPKCSHFSTIFPVDSMCWDGFIFLFVSFKDLPALIGFQ